MPRVEFFGVKYITEYVEKLLKIPRSFQNVTTNKL
jgi:hypothetical protein